MNKVILSGRLTKDPEVRYTQTNNTMVASFTLAVNRAYVKQGEERQSDFISIVAWNKQAERASQYLQKGSKVNIAGRIQTRTWEDDKGVKHYVTEVICEEIEFLDSKKEGTMANNTDTEDSPNTVAETEDTNEPILSGDDLPF